MDESNQKIIVTPSFTVLRRCNKALFDSTDETEYMKRICDIIVTVGGYEGALIWLKEGPGLDTSFSGSLQAYSGFHGRIVFDVETFINSHASEKILNAFQHNHAIIYNSKSEAQELSDREDKLQGLFPSLSSLILLPLSSAGKFLGFFAIGSRHEKVFQPAVEEFLKEISMELWFGVQTMRSEKTRKITENALKERMRELQGLFSLNTLADSSKPIPRMLTEFVQDVLPESMHQPDKIIATIELDGKTFSNRSKKIKEQTPYLSAPIIINSRMRGKLLISHTGTQPKEEDEYESKLILAYADKLSKYLSRLEATKQLSERGEQMRRILDSLPDMIFQLDEEFTIIWANRKALEVNDEAIGKHCYEAYFNQSEICSNCPSLDALKTGEVRKGSVYFKKKNGGAEESLWENIGVPLKDSAGETVGVIEIARDVTDHMRAQEDLRNLSTHLQTVREEERSTISREIHDELGQNLTALKMDIYWLNKHLPGPNNTMKDKTVEMLSIVDDTVLTVQRIMSQLRPILLDDLDLNAAVEWEMEDFKSRTGIDYSLDMAESIRYLNKKLATTLFRIFQEALTNVARHAEATKVAVQIENEESSVILSVEDNGRGIEETKIFGNRSYGLLGMRERVLSWDGDLNIRRKPKGGTHVQAIVPYVTMEET